MSTSDPPGSEAGSDITDFAAWEAEHPSQPLEERTEQRAARMRIWGDRDSSNDARSSEEVEQENMAGFVQGTKEGNGVGREEIPSSGVESEEEPQVRWNEGRFGKRGQRVQRQLANLSTAAGNRTRRIRCAAE
jgi:hypothetical protein